MSTPNTTNKVWKVEQEALSSFNEWGTCVFTICTSLWVWHFTPGTIMYCGTVTRSVRRWFSVGPSPSQAGAVVLDDASDASTTSRRGAAAMAIIAYELWGSTYYLYLARADDARQELGSIATDQTA